MKKDNESKGVIIEQTKGIKKETARESYLESMDKKLDDVLMERYVPVDIYLDTDDLSALETINESVKKVLDSLEMETFSEPEIFKGSIIEKFWAVTKSVASNVDVIKKISGLISIFQKSSAELNTDRLFSKKEPVIHLSETLKYLKDVPNISVRVGSLLITKSTTRDIPLIQIKNLTRDEVILIDRNPGILKNPRTIHTRLNTLKHENF
ncbi:MAG: hypothetical protein KAR14_16065, partial [Candidatus Aminicenantes bacterium]|nr:hypothetical protein [Candidatus Aminicenantes bacterium]